MKNTKAISSVSGGVLLFAIVTTFVLAMIGSALVLFTSNQYRIIDAEIDRKQALCWLKAGMEYANFLLRTNPSGIQLNQEFSLPEKTDIKITIINPDPDNLSDYKIEVRTQY
jgi:hypothetical protein